MNRPPMLRAALIGGAAFGVAGGLPLIGAINCLCCALAIGAGMTAAYLYSKECKSSGVEFSGGAGAKLGAITGLFYTLAHMIVGGLASLATGPADVDQILEQMESSPGMTPEGMEIAEKIIPVMVGSGGVIVMLIVVLVCALIFSTIGGLIGGSVFKVAPAGPPAPPAVGDAPPPSGM